MTDDTRATDAELRAIRTHLNGVTLTELEEPSLCLDEAHAVIFLLSEAMDDNEAGPINPLILQSAARAAGTLVHLAAIAARGASLKRGDC